MQHMTITLPDELAQQILELKEDSRFTQCSEASIAQLLLECGAALLEAEQASA